MKETAWECRGWSWARARLLLAAEWCRSAPAQLPLHASLQVVGRVKDAVRVQRCLAPKRLDGWRGGDGDDEDPGRSSLSRGWTLITSDSKRLTPKILFEWGEEAWGGDFQKSQCLPKGAINSGSPGKVPRDPGTWLAIHINSLVDKETYPEGQWPA